MRVIRAERQRHRVALTDRVLRAIDQHVQPHAENMLVMRTVDQRSDQGGRVPVTRLMNCGKLYEDLTL